MTRNAKGDYQWAIKVYYEAELMDSGAPSWTSVVAEIQVIDASLRETYLPLFTLLPKTETK